jgi:hypothetical protein
MMLSETDRWILGLVASVVMVGLVAPFITHRLARRRDLYTARRAAQAQFRDTVLSELQGLYPLPFQWPSNVDQTLKQKTPKLQSAVAQFRPYVAWWQRRALDRAWFRYRNGTGRKIDLQNYHHYTEFGSNPHAKENFRRNVDRLLRFSR